MRKPGDRIIDRAGQKYGKLTFVSFSHMELNQSMWKCKCDCGSIIIVRSSSLVAGKTRSCGCLRLKHGHCYLVKSSKTYSAYYGMITRCKNKKYKNYHGRGIKVCKKWLNSFENFLKDMGSIPGDKHSLDRIDNNKGYYKKNCRWATRQEQEYNKRTKKHSSKYRGVYYSSDRNKFRARIMYNGKIYDCGAYLDEKEAALAYNKKYLELTNNTIGLNSI